MIESTVMVASATCRISDLAVQFINELTASRVIGCRFDGIDRLVLIINWGDLAVNVCYATLRITHD